ncbi:MAG TPA: choice-of-anchor tandem repeat GloVer-containing protein [Cyclobacteriaceae bacterium]|nr:choice-of-anchor tandem repeat GloVer-containing protein [Cyclobacteriaceae bacterium]
MCFLSASTSLAQQKLYGVSTLGGKLARGSVFSLNPDGSGYEVHRHIGAHPSAPGVFVVVGPDGYLYGASGTQIFKMKPDGTDVQMLYNGGQVPFAGIYSIAVSASGDIYGTLQDSNIATAGVIFKLNADGSSLVKLHTYTTVVVGSPNTQPTNFIGSDGKLYGANYAGGPSPSEGVIYRINLDGTNYQILHDFSVTSPEQFPNGLMEGNDGKLYGVARKDMSTTGVIYRMDKDGTNFEIIKEVTQTKLNPLTQLGDNKLYLTGSDENGNGRIIRLDADGNNYEVILSSFDMTVGSSTRARLLPDNDGKLIGTTDGGGANNTGAMFHINPDGSGFEKIADFPAAASMYRSNLVTIDDKVFGFNFGDEDSKPFAYSVNSDGSDFEVIHTFDDQQDTGRIVSGLSRGTDNLLYGISQLNSVYGVALVKLSPGAPQSDQVLPISLQYPGGPASTPVQGDNNVWYTTSPYGGTGNGGFMFKFNSDGTAASKVKEFSQQADGQGVTGDLTLASNGYLYGAISTSGLNSRGSLYRIKPDGSDFSIVRAFSATDGSMPYSGVIEGPDGYLYGTLMGNGVIYRIKKDGTDFSRVYTLTPTDGSYMFCELVIIGNTIFATAAFGGTSSKGTIFKVNIDGSGFTKLHDFGGSDGETPYAGLLLFNNALFGVTYKGGANNAGVVYKLNTDGSSFAKILDLEYQNGAGPTMRLFGFCDAPPKPTITTNEYVLTSSASTGNQWYNYGAAIDGATGQTFTATASGSYTVRVTSGGCESLTSKNVLIDFCTSPAKPTVSVSETNVLTSSASSGNQWYKDGNPIDGATAQTYTPTVSGSYTVIISAGTCVSQPSDAKSITICIPPSKPTISVTETVKLTSSATSGNQWYLNGEAIAGATAQTYTATTSGTYNVRVILGSCESPTSEPVGVTICTPPAKPTVTLTGSNKLTSSAAEGNQWYRNGTIILNASSQTYTVTESGSYKVQVTLGCSSPFSDETAVTITGLGDEALSPGFFPNPVGETLHIIPFENGETKVTIYDLVGRKYFDQTVNSTTMDLSELRSGVYIIQLEGEGKQFKAKLIRR